MLKVGKTDIDSLKTQGLFAPKKLIILNTYNVLVILECSKKFNDVAKRANQWFESSKTYTRLRNVISMAQLSSVVSSLLLSSFCTFIHLFFCYRSIYIT